jgi:multicomponent Na+:H+ antiporter subunit E
LRASDTQPFRIAAVDIALRALSFLLLWVILIGTGSLDTVVGLFAVVTATWASLLLVPAGTGMVTPLAVVVLLARLPWQSLVAGVDVARRALDPRLPLHPGLVSCPPRLPPGLARNAFRALMSLQPGSLPVSIGAEGDILVHCLDVHQPVAAQMAAEETLFLRLSGGGTGRG